MKNLAILLLLFAPVLAVAGEQSSNLSEDKTKVQAAIAVLKKEAKPVIAGQIIKDPDGCLYGIAFESHQLRLVRILDERKNPVCDK